MMTSMDDKSLALELINQLNSVLMRLPGQRVASRGTRLSLREANGHYHDAGLDCVAEFHGVFGAHIAREPALPDYGTTSNYELSVYQEKAAKLGKDLKKAAQRMAEFGDKGGSLLLIRLQLCQEELAELAEAMLARDIVGCLDALTDMTYVADGTYHTLGLGHYKLAALAEVHRSNMSKLGLDGVPIVSSAGRIVKGPDYSPPDLAGVLLGPDHTIGEALEIANKRAADLVRNTREPGEFGDGATVKLGD